MKRLMEILGFIVAIFASIAGLMAFTSFQIDSKGYITADQAVSISEKQGYISNKEIKRDLFFIDKRLSRVDGSIVVIREDVKQILKEVRR
jgi:hypothetical protein